MAICAMYTKLKASSLGYIELTWQSPLHGAVSDRSTQLLRSGNLRSIEATEQAHGMAAAPTNSLA